MKILLLYICVLQILTEARPGTFTGMGNDSLQAEIIDFDEEEMDGVNEEGFIASYVNDKNCSFSSDEDYKCVPYYSCEDGEVITDGRGIMDLRSFSSSTVLDPSSSGCPGFFEVCCRLSDSTKNNSVLPTAKSSEDHTYRPQCGRRNSHGVGVQILHEQFKGNTQFGEWPHMCAVLETQTLAYGEDINKYVCGASLIAPGVVLTSAHCVANILTGNHCPTTIPKEKIKIRCGEWDTQQGVEPLKHQDRNVRNIKIHPQFNPSNMRNDFAILFMEEDFKLAPHVDTICLPDNLAGIHSYDQANCIATGWGKDKFGKLGEYQVIMKQVEMDMVNSTECERRLRSTRLGEDFSLHKSFVCAGGEKDKDTCKGDGGGPLVCPLALNSTEEGHKDVQQEPRYVQAGIIAWGIDCGVEGNPGVYANVADGLCFIDWATKCQGEVLNYFNISGCEDWAPQEMEKLQSEIVVLQKKLETSTQAGNYTAYNLYDLHCNEVHSQEALYTFMNEKPICIEANPTT